ncbi:MAG: phosphoribosylformylglycinamidine synthase subunit PurS [Thermodesulfobacteriota bacterium]
MKEFNIKIEIKLKPVVLDPQGKSVLSALHKLGFKDVTNTRIGKIIELSVNGDDKDKVLEKVDSMCKILLANPVIENYEFQIVN